MYFYSIYIYKRKALQGEQRKKNEASTNMAHPGETKVLVTRKKTKENKRQEVHHLPYCKGLGSFFKKGMGYK
jgi:hypothetical protein